MKFGKKFKNNSDLTLTIALTVGIIILINFFSYNFFWRHDLTSAGLYSITPATKKIVKNLPDVVNVKVYFSSNLPSQFLATRQSVTDVLSDYQSYSSNFKVQYIDPKDGAEAEASGVPKLQFNDLQQDKLEVVNGYMGLTINYRGKSEVIPAVQNVANLEYEITSRLKKLTGDLPTVGILNDHGSPDINQAMPQAFQELSKLYPVEVIAAEKIPDKVKTLLIIDPNENFTEAELKSLDNFLMKGNSIITLVDGVTVSQDLKPTENKINLFDWLAKYGLKVNHNLVLDSSAGLASFNQGIVTFSVAYPYWPRIINKNFDQSNALVSGLDGVVLPWASSIEIDNGKLTDKTKIDYLAKSSAGAWVSQTSATLDPGQKFAKPTKTEQYNLAVAMSGEIKSAYSDQTTNQGRLYVVSDGEFIQDNFWQGNPSNLVLAQNLIDGASLGTDLSSIRAKKIADNSLDVTGVNTDLIRYLNIFGLTILALAFGLTRYYLRKRTKMIEI